MHTLGQPRPSSPFLSLCLVALASPIAAQSIPCTTRVDEAHQNPFTGKNPSSHSGTFTLDPHATIDASIKISASAGFIGAIWQTREESVEGFSGRTYMLRARPTPAEYEAVVHGQMDLVSTANAYPGI